MSPVIGTTVHRNDLRAEVERELAAIFTRSTEAASRHGTHFQHLWELAAQHVQGGKLLRPLLLLETYDALRDKESAHARTQVVRIAAAVEALHFAFLLHDDVIDGDLIRRGRPNLIGDLVAQAPVTAASHQWAQAGGILAGDLLLSAAHQAFARADVEADARIRLLDLLEETIHETTAGELVDVGLGTGVIAADLPTVLAMTHRKTAAYTFGLPLRAAAILAGAPAETETLLVAAGTHLGLAYQLQDDLLSTFGDAAQHGKDSFSDLREGKQTALICFARMTSAWTAIEPHLGDPELTADAGRLVRGLLAECGAERFVQGIIDDERTAFAHKLDTGGAAALPPAVRRVLHEVATALEGRCA